MNRLLQDWRISKTVAAVLALALQHSVTVGAQELEFAERKVLGGAAPALVAKTDETHRLMPGDRLLAGPRPHADLILEVPAAANTGAIGEVIERRETEGGVWLRLRLGGQLGWLQISRTGQASGGAAAVLSDPARMDLRAEALLKARAAVVGGREVTWEWRLSRPGGLSMRRPVTVWTDLEGQRFEWLQQLTECLPWLYAERFGGVETVETPPELAIDLVVFAQRQAYERFAASSTSVMAHETGGFEVDGVVVLAAETDLEVDFVGTAAHELGHALNRLAFPHQSPPPWVEEGMAEDLAHSVEAAYIAGVRPCERPGGWSTTQSKRAVVLDEDLRPREEVRLVRSARARALLCYSPRQGLAELLAFDRAQLTSIRDRVWRYVESLLLVRSLLAETTEATAGRDLDLQSPPVSQPQVRLEKMLAELDWRAEELELMDC